MLGQENDQARASEEKLCDNDHCNDNDDETEQKQSKTYLLENL